MEINKDVTVNLTTDDLKEIVVEHLKAKGISVKSVYFKVKGCNLDDDYRSEFPLVYKLDSVMCKGVEI